MWKQKQKTKKPRVFPIVRKVKRLNTLFSNRRKPFFYLVKKAGKRIKISEKILFRFAKKEILPIKKGFGKWCAREGGKIHFYTLLAVETLIDMVDFAEGLKEMIAKSPEAIKLRRKVRLIKRRISRKWASYQVQFSTKWDQHRPTIQKIIRAEKRIFKRAGGEIGDQLIYLADVLIWYENELTKIFTRRKVLRLQRKVVLYFADLVNAFTNRFGKWEPFKWEVEFDTTKIKFVLSGVWLVLKFAVLLLGKIIKELEKIDFEIPIPKAYRLALKKVTSTALAISVTISVLVPVLYFPQSPISNIYKAYGDTGTKTWNFTGNAEGLADPGNHASVAFSFDATDNAVLFSTTVKSLTNAVEFGRKSTTGETWETWGVPVGATVTNVQITAWQEKLVANSKLSAHSIKARIINSSGTTIHTAGDILDVALGTTLDASYQAGVAGTQRAVDASYQASTTDVRLELEYTVTTLGGGGTAAVDQRFDVITLTITYTPLVATTTLGNGTNPGNSTVAPGSGITDLDAFTLATNTGTDSVTALTVTLATGTAASLSEVRVTSDNGATLYFTAVANPATDAVSFSGGTAIPVNTTSTQFKVRITPKTHANMPAPPGSSYAVTGTVTAFTSTNGQAGTDTDSATITVDNASPANVTSSTATAGDQQVSLSWTNPGDADFDSIVVLRRATTAVADVPAEGTTYIVGNTIGTATVACVTSSTSCTDSSLTNGTAYHYKIFSKDTRGNYSVGVVPTGSPVTPSAITTLADGTDPGNSTIGPGASVTDIDKFTFTASSGTDNITAVTVTLAPANSFDNISKVEITDDIDADKCTDIDNPASTTLSFTGCSLAVTTTATTFKVRITPKTHANMPAVPGASYATTATVTGWTGTNVHAGTDTDSATITVDNLSPANVTSASVSPSDSQTSLSWSNPGDADFSLALILRRAAAAVTDTPVEGTTYSAGDPIGLSTVACTTATTSCTDTGLTNGTAYHYKIFAKDTRGNYSQTGVVPTGSPATPNSTTTIGNGTNPSNATIAPGSAITDLDAFTLVASSGTDSITALTVTLAVGTAARLSEIRITSDNGSTLYFAAVANPATDAVSFSGGTPIPVTITSTPFKVRITPKAHADMPVPPGGSYAVTGTVTAFTSTNQQSGTDSSSATITIDNSSPANVTSASGTAGDTEVSLSWTNPADSDFNSVVVLRRAITAVADVPVEGTTYIVGNTIGTATVACVTALTSCTDTGLTNGTAYHYKIFAKDTRGNYSDAGVIPTGSPFTPVLTPRTTLGNGTNPSNATVAPGSGITDLDAFTFVTNTGTDSVTALTVTLATGTAAGLSEIRITSDDGATLYFTAVANPATDAVSFSGGIAIPASTTSAQFKVRITPKTHANMPAVPGSSYAVTGTVTAFTSTNVQSGTDSASATITIDNASPANVTSTSGTAGDTQVSLSWTNPGDSDFDSIVVLRRASSAIADVPVEGTTYIVGNTIGTATVACVTSSTSCTDTGLTNGTAYHYKIFVKDTRGNYSAGVVPTGSPYTPTAAPITSIATGTDPANATLEPGSADQYINQFTLAASTGTDTVTALTVTTTNTTAVSSIKIWNDGLTTQYFATVSSPSGNNWSFSGGTSIPVTTTVTPFRVIVTFKNHADLAAGTYAVTANASAFTSTNTQSGGDAAGTTLTVDNQPTAEAAFGTITAGDAQVALTWTNPADADFNQVVLLRHTSAVTDSPADGTIYSAGNTIGSAIVACVSSSTSCTDTGLTNDTAYHYKIFARDTYKNYSAGVATGPHTPASAAPPPSSGGGSCGCPPPTPPEPEPQPEPEPKTPQVEETPKEAPKPVMVAPRPQPRPQPQVSPPVPPQDTPIINPIDYNSYLLAPWEKWVFRSSEDINLAISSAERVQLKLEQTVLKAGILAIDSANNIYKSINLSIIKTRNGLMSLVYKSGIKIRLAVDFAAHLQSELINTVVYAVDSTYNFGAKLSYKTDLVISTKAGQLQKLGKNLGLGVAQFISRISNSVVDEWHQTLAYVDQIESPRIDFPDINLPDIRMPKFQFPNITLPKFAWEPDQSTGEISKDSEAVVFRSGELELIADQDQEIQAIVGFSFKAEVIPTKKALSIGGTFKFTDPDKDGVWTAQVKMPEVAGLFKLNTKIAYADGSNKELRSDVLIDPEGYVFENHPRGELRIENAKVTLWQDINGQWQVWPSQKYNQTNPQITSKTGEYSFLAPAGKYYLEALAENYEVYKGRVFNLDQASPVHEAIELKYIGR